MSPMRKTTFALGVVLFLGACSGDPLKGVPEALAAGDLASAQRTLDAALEKDPGLLQARIYRFVVYRHLVLHGDPDAQQQTLNKAIADYDVVVKALGINPDYAGMEESLRSNGESRKLLSAARKTLYGE